MKLLFMFLFYIGVLNAQVYTVEDSMVYSFKMRFAAEQNLKDKNINDVIIVIGKSFLGTNYEASALEKEGNEQLVIDLTGLDCTTFLENALVFARLIKKDNTSFEDYKKGLTLIRYRDGKIDKYPSRLHYFSDWIYDNIKKSVVEDVTEQIGGEPVKFNLSFMSENPKYYRQLKENPDFIPVIKEQEEKINSRQYYYIPKEKVDEAEHGIESGDLIAFTTSIKGLDIGHTGLAIKQPDGRIYLLHAPQAGSRVQITEKPLSEYILGVKKHSGIIVLRAVEPICR